MRQGQRLLLPLSIPRTRCIHIRSARYPIRQWQGGTCQYNGFGNAKTPTLVHEQPQQSHGRSFSDKAKAKTSSSTAKISTNKGPKKNKAKSSKTADGKKSRSDKDMDLMIRCLDAPMRKEPPISAEEQERRRQIVRRYTMGLFNEHNEREHDLACKIKIKLHAVKMLPNGSTWKAEALNDKSGDMPPEYVHIPFWTPPIPDFDMSKYEEYFDEK